MFPDSSFSLSKLCIYGSIILTISILNYLTNTGSFIIVKKLFCKVVCYVKKSLYGGSLFSQISGNESIASLPIFFTEIFVLYVTIMLINRYKDLSGTDKIDDLLQESKEALRETNNFLEKWRLRRVKKYSANNPTAGNEYLDDEPQEIKPYAVEVPILHMAIVDTLGPYRSQPERGDWSDTPNVVTDSTLLSIPSLSEEGDNDQVVGDPRFDYNNRYLWDVIEEEGNED